MTKPFLRSGSLDAVVALGENGQPIYTLAQPLREALRLKEQLAVANCLAIPQPNPTGDRIDWYSPRPGKVTSWQAASAVEQQAALHELDACRTALAELRQQAALATQPAWRLFGALLNHVLCFPDSHHVYLVDGKPVLTFWGFSLRDQPEQADPFACLRPPAEATATSESTPPPANVAPRPTLTEPAIHQPPAQPHSIARRLPGFRWGVGLTFAALLAAIWLLWLRDRLTPPHIAAPAPSLASPAQQLKPAVTFELNLPLEHATVMPPPPQPVVTPPVIHDKNALIMPTAAVKAGSTRFLNGQWRALPAIKTPLTGKLPSLRYQLYNGKGYVSLKQVDGVMCKVKVETGLMQSGNLVINSRTKARCSDGSRYQMPEIVCTPKGDDIAAQCTGRYSADTLYPMMIKREKK